MDHFIIHGSYHEVGCVFLMVIWSKIRTGQYGDDDHWRDKPHFTAFSPGIPNLPKNLKCCDNDGRDDSISDSRIQNRSRSSLKE